MQRKERVFLALAMGFAVKILGVLVFCIYYEFLGVLLSVIGLLVCAFTISLYSAYNEIDEIHQEVPVVRVAISNELHSDIHSRGSLLFSSTDSRLNTVSCYEMYYVDDNEKLNFVRISKDELDIRVDTSTADVSLIIDEEVKRTYSYIWDGVRRINKDVQYRLRVPERRMSDVLNGSYQVCM